MIYEQGISPHPDARPASFYVPYASDGVIVREGETYELKLRDGRFTVERVEAVS